MQNGQNHSNKQYLQYRGTKDAKALVNAALKAQIVASLVRESNSVFYILLLLVAWKLIWW